MWVVLRRLALLLGLLLFLPGCPHDPHAGRYTTTKPVDIDLVGTYVLTEDSRALVKERGGYDRVSASIELGDGGVLRVTDIPDWWNTPFGRPGGRFDSASGRWQVEFRQNRWWMLEFTFPRTSPLASNGEEPTQFTIHGVPLVGASPPFTIHATIGDPDEGLAMEFVKVGKSAGR